MSPDASFFTAATEDIVTDDKDTKLINRVLNWFKFAFEHPNEVAFRKEAEEDMKFVKGQQWDDADVSRLKKQNHPVLTINRIKKQLASVVGTHLSNRKDIKPVPVDSSPHDLSVANLFFALIKHAMHKGKVQWHFDKAQKESAACGRGYMWPDIDYARDFVNGEPRVVWESWRDVYVDPDARMMDLSDATFVIRYKWFADLELIERYPTHVDKIKEGFVNVFTEQGTEPKLTEGDPSDGYKTPDKHNIFVDKENKRIRILECWYKIDARREFMVDLANSSMEPWEGTEEEFAAFKSAIASANPERAEGMKLETRTVTQIKYAVVAGGVSLLLESGDTPYDKPPLDRMLPIIPFVYEELDGEKEGIVRRLKDPQRETNKRRSQHMHLMNKLALGGWIADEGATAKPEDLEERVRQAGFVLWKRQGKEITPVPTPNPGEIYFLVDKQSKDDFFDIAINPDLLGIEGSGAESGRAIMLRLTQGQLQIAEPLTNLDWSYKILGLWLMGLIQLTYNQQKVVQVMGPDGLEALAHINQPQEGGGVVNVLEDLKNGNQPESFQDFRNIEFDVVITTSSFSPTARISQFAMLTELAQAGYGIPAQAILEASDLPNKQQLIEQMGTLTPSGPGQPSSEVQGRNADIGRTTSQ